MRHNTFSFSISSRLLAFFALLFFTAGVSPAKAWQLSLQRIASESPRFSGPMIVLDPDDWSRREILAMRAAGRVPVAWLNVAQLENGRAFLRGYDSKTLVAHPRFLKEASPPVRFYLNLWRTILRQRIREIAHKGFSGLFLSGSHAHHIISDNPISLKEMRSLLEFIGDVFRRETPDGTLFLHKNLDLLAEPDLARLLDGIAVEGLWISPSGNWRRPWEREPLVEQLIAFKKLGKHVLTIDPPAPERLTNRAQEESRNLGFEPLVATIPIQVQRSPLP